MRKRITNPIYATTAPANEQWFDLEQIAQVEITSENLEHSIEKALLPNSEIGWRAAETGEQVIRLIFDHPQRINRIALHFIELQVERTQEFVLRWFDKSSTVHEIVRQQWNFSSDSTQEIEDYRVELDNVTILELIIVPDIKNKQAVASLQKLRLA